ncbi:hypothetical protein KCU61_g229, partial [Aureobasidium melanogenum]
MLTQRLRWSNGRLQNLMAMRLKSSQTRGRRPGLLGGLRRAKHVPISEILLPTLKSAMYLFYVYHPSSTSRTRIFRAILGYRKNCPLAPWGHTIKTHSHSLYNFLRSPKTTFLTEDGYLARKILQRTRVPSSAVVYSVLIEHRMTESAVAATKLVRFCPLSLTWLESYQISMHSMQNLSLCSKSRPTNGNSNNALATKRVINIPLHRYYVNHGSRCTVSIDLLLAGRLLLVDIFCLKQSCDSTFKATASARQLGNVSANKSWLFTILHLPTHTLHSLHSLHHRSPLPLSSSNLLLSLFPASPRLSKMEPRSPSLDSPVPNTASDQHHKDKVHTEVTTEEGQGREENSDEGDDGHAIDMSISSLKIWRALEIFPGFVVGFFDRDSQVDNGIDDGLQYQRCICATTQHCGRTVQSFQDRFLNVSARVAECFSMKRVGAPSAVELCARIISPILSSPSGSRYLGRWSFVPSMSSYEIGLSSSEQSQSSESECECMRTSFCNVKTTNA